MSKLVVVENVSLDGVMQAPACYGQKRRDDFERAGWAAAYDDADKARIMGRGMAQAGPLLFGRRTYLDFFAIWPGRRDNPYSEVLDNAQKYVVSTTLREPLPWKNSTLIGGELTARVTRLKEEARGDVVVLGSGELVRSLMAADLVDEYVLLVCPLVLGKGRRLFPDEGPRAPLQLAAAEPTSKGVVIATYRRGAPLAQ